MPPFKKIPKTEAAAAAQGLARMTSFFSAMKSPCRPAKKTPKYGHPAAEKALAPAAAQEAASVKPKAKKPKATRTGNSKGKGLMKMAIAEVHDIPFTTLQTHITPNESKRIKLGSGVVRKPIPDDQRETIIVDVPIRMDRANESASVGDAVDILKQMCPKYSHKQLESKKLARIDYVG